MVNPYAYKTRLFELKISKKGDNILSIFKNIFNLF
jgi:hypothetical protein